MGSQWTVDIKQWKVDSGWTVHIGQWTVDRGPWTLMEWQSSGTVPEFNFGKFRFRKILLFYEIEILRNFSQLSRNTKYNISKIQISRKRQISRNLFDVAASAGGRTTFEEPCRHRGGGRILITNILVTASGFPLFMCDVSLVNKVSRLYIYLIFPNNLRTAQLVLAPRATHYRAISLNKY